MSLCGNSVEWKAIRHVTGTVHNVMLPKNMSRDISGIGKESVSRTGQTDMDID